MKMSPMIVQALWEIRSPMMQLPHINEDMQKYFMSKKRQISSIQSFCEMKDEDRRVVLKSLTDDQYADIMKVCSTMPLIDFKVHVEGRKYLKILYKTK
jgi:translocation protein SEC63